MTASAFDISPQWIFPIQALQHTPTEFPLQKELYDRARGVEFLFRLGSSLQLPSSAMFTAATWFHRFYMRLSMEDYHRQHVAAACIFLATKTEECGRKLRDVAKVYCSKVMNVEIQTLHASKAVDEAQADILATEEALLEALCFDFAISSPHSELLDLCDAHGDDHDLREYAWSLAHDSYRTPLCVLYPPKITAAACYVLAQRVLDGQNSASLDARISSPAPSASLPTPPSHKPASPEASRFAINYFGFDESELASLAEALCILIEFYTAQDSRETHPYLLPIATVPPPTTSTALPRLYVPPSQITQQGNNEEVQAVEEGPGRTPSSSHGGDTPSK